LRFAIHTTSLTNDVVIPGATQQQTSATASVTGGRVGVSNSRTTQQSWFSSTKR